MKRASAILKSLLIAMFFACIALVIRATGRDETFQLSEKLVYLFMAFLNAAIYAIVRVVEYMVRPTAGRDSR
jgi:hypothetical protein